MVCPKATNYIQIFKKREVNVKWQKLILSKYGITGTTEVVYNPSYELLFEEETKPELEGF